VLMMASADEGEQDWNIIQLNNYPLAWNIK